MSSRFTDFEIAAYFKDHFDFAEDVEIKVIEYGEGMFFVAFGRMSNPIEKRAVSFAVNTIFMTDEEVEAELQKAVEMYHDHFLEMNMLQPEIQFVPEDSVVEEKVKTLGEIRAEILRLASMI